MNPQSSFKPYNLKLKPFSYRRCVCFAEVIDEMYGKKTQCIYLSLIDIGKFLWTRNHNVWNYSTQCWQATSDRQFNFCVQAVYKE